MDDKTRDKRVKSCTVWQDQNKRDKLLVARPETRKSSHEWQD